MGKSWCPYLVSAVHERFPVIRNTDTMIHLIVWILIVVFECLSYGNVQAHKQHMTDMQAEVTQKNTLFKAQQLVEQVFTGNNIDDCTMNSNPAIGDVATALGAFLTGGCPQATAPPMLSDQAGLTFKQLNQIDSFLGRITHMQTSKHELSSWALESSATASLMTAFVGLLAVVAVVLMHVGSDGVVPGGLPPFLVALSPAALLSSIAFGFLVRIVLATDTLIDFWLRQTTHSSLVMSATMGMFESPLQQVTWQTATERNPDRSNFWIVALVFKFYAVALVRANVRIADRPTHAQVSSA